MKQSYLFIFSNLLKLLRKSKSISTSEFARQIDVSKSMISKFENGVNLPSIKVLIKLADYFCVSTDFLLGRSNDPEWKKCKSNREL
ncbi:MAG: helix-turn-helix transcriptional regulator [Phycisphaerales bacterium]